MEVTNEDATLARSENRAESGPIRANHASARRGHYRPTPFPRRGGDALHVIGVLVRDDHCLDRFGSDARDGKPMLENSGRESGIDENARPIRLHEIGVT